MILGNFGTLELRAEKDGNEAFSDSKHCHVMLKQATNPATGPRTNSGAQFVTHGPEA